jgi:hypothetical protein
MVNPWYLALGLAVIALTPLLLRRLHRLALRLEERGYLYYRNRKPQSGALSSILAFNGAIEPGIAYVLEARQKQQSELTQRDMVLARLLSLLQTEAIDREAIRELLMTYGGADWPALYDEAVQLALRSDPSGTRSFPKAAEVSPNR